VPFDIRLDRLHQADWGSCDKARTRRVCATGFAACATL
jgi:hypothetical protein